MARSFRLKISKDHFDELRRLVLADHPREAGAFALAGAATHAHGTDILIRRPIAIPKGHFKVQHEYRLEVSSAAVNGLAALCERNALGAVICHSHPGDIPYSPSDDHGERRIIDTLRHFMPTSAPTASLLFFPGGVRGRVWIPGSLEPVHLTEIIILGRYVQRHNPTAPHCSHVEADAAALFDRQVLAFGSLGQQAIHASRVAVVGVGGTGSPIAEQLVRLGTNDLILVDPDVFEPSNLTRMYGTFSPGRTRRWFSRRKPQHKVALLAEHLRRIRPQVAITALPKNIVLHDASRVLRDRDLIFLCTDEHWGRSVVNELAYQYMIPTINVGARIAAPDGRISAAVGVVDILRPGMPCLWCRQTLSAERVAAESMPRQHREALEREGYVEGLDTRAPSVISLTTTVAGLAVTSYLQLLTDFMGNAGDLSRLNHDALTGEVRRGRALIQEGCVCRKVYGYGDLKPLSTVDELSFLE